MIIIVSIILLLIAVSDKKEKRIPNSLLGMLLLCAILSGILSEESSLSERIWGSISVSSFLAGIIWLKPGAFGAGDVKLMAVSGFLLGWKQNLAAFIFAVMLAGVYCIVGLIGKKVEKTSAIAFGAFLCAGIELAMFFADEFWKII